MRILVAEDDRTSHWMLAGILQHWHYDTLSVYDGATAYAELRKPDAPQLAILDWMMPGMEGTEIARRIVSERVEDPPYIIIVTSRGEKEDIAAALDAGANDHLCKPYDINELRARLGVGRRMLEMRQALFQAKADLEDRVRVRTAEVTRLLQQKEAFIHNLSHDLRTPLTPLLTLLPLATNEPEAGPRREMLELCLENARSLRQLTQRALNFSRLSAADFKIKRVDLAFSPWLSRTLSGWQPALAKAGLVLKEKIAMDLKLSGDPTLLKQAIDELMHNAMVFSSPGDSISVEACWLPEGIVVSLSDTGAGMSPDQQAQAFDEFYKADPARSDRSSTGLGLSIASQIIRLHGGAIGLSSAGLGLGTTVRLVLPAANPMPEASRA